jgi:hypothetical protein
MVTVVPTGSDESILSRLMKLKESESKIRRSERDD